MSPMNASTPQIEFAISTCRICLQNNEHGEEDMTCIFQISPEEAPDSNRIQISKMIEECVGIEIKHHSQLSSLMCRNCMVFLNIAYKFRTMCRNSQNYLNEYVVRPPDLGVTQPLPIGEEHTSRQDPSQEFFVEEIQLSNSKPDTLNVENRAKENSRSSDMHSEELSDYYYDECYLETEETANKKNAAKQKFVVNQNLTTEETVKHQFRHKTESSAPSKTLGISSDGAAVIEEKAQMPVVKKAKKEKRTHICEICGNIYDRRYSLVAHMRRHRDEKPYECEICGQAFHCNFELSRHIRKHTGVRPYICEYCKRAFGDRSTLMKHERIHRNERPYECETCGKSFTYSSVLKVHQLTHTGEKPYNCELCGKRFSRSHHLRAHLETLLHQNDPKSKILLKKIKRAEESLNLGIEIFANA